ncbi:IclR family transcriptional regulator [Pigmentiphaga sp.]|uniref:IclR family transcriptional regulator n=1 Tax=Pigmentiphaga sp. TaxID=1977564 RepID=UPI00128D5CD2|nr:IclR family transcriptional regulator [Pigmentiphaga sp.]MPS28034.1 IclR family transcriptional regulator [Alcaligenaceae bacterium SAGV5]MPS54629.1 IclR family transcriptional regulator [Alcaligenaceae bacterium SAGV3]MPT56998.1 IclR family transcriptional regulator [Alcaligenaceae bacterium]
MIPAIVPMPRQPSTSAAPPGNRVQVIDRAMLLLDVLMRMPRGASALELAQATELDRTTVHRVLRTLAFWGMVQAREGVYALGPKCLVLGTAQHDRLGIRRAALPHAIELQEKGVGKRRAIVSISVPALDEVVIIERIWAPSVPLNIITDIGTHFPLDASVSGRAILAAWPREQGIAHVGEERYAAAAERLESIRAARGLSFGLSEMRPGVGTLACPVFGRGGEAVAALIVAGLALEEELDPEAPLAQHALRSAANISAVLRAS